MKQSEAQAVRTITQYINVYIFPLLDKLLLRIKPLPNSIYNDRYVSMGAAGGC